MPSRQPKLIKQSDMPIDAVSQTSVLNKYQKRDHAVNTRPEGNYRTLKGCSNPEGALLVDGAKEKLIQSVRIPLPTGVIQNYPGDELDLLAAVEERELELTLTPQQYYFMTSRHKFLWFCAGVASGKTFMGARWVYARIIDNPETLGLIGANSYDQLNQSTLKPFFEFLDEIGMPYVINRMPPKEWGVARKFKEYENVMVFPNGAHVLLRTLDKPANLAGLEVGWFWIDETFATNPKTFDVIIARLRCPKSKALMGRITSTPNGHDWLYKKFSTNPKFYRKIHQSSRENPLVGLKPDFAEYLDSLESSYDAVLVNQELHGRIISVQFGRTYYNFSEINHVRNKYLYDPTRPLMLCWDFNTGEAPMSTVIAQEFYNSRTGLPEIQFLDEVVEKYSDTENNMRLVMQKYGNAHKGKFEIYGDAFGEKSTSKSDYEQMLETMVHEFGINKSRIEFFVPEGNNPPQRDRTVAFNVMLRNSRGQRRCFFSQNCKMLINDMKNVAPDKKSTSVINKSAKIDLTHPSDAAGYMIHYRHPVRRQTFQSYSVNMNSNMIVGGG